MQEKRLFSVMFDYILDSLHTDIPLCALVSTFFQVVRQHIQLILGQVFLVAELVLQTCPEVHGDSAELYLGFYKALLVFKEYRHLNDKVKTSVAVGLGVLYVVLFLDEEDVVLLQKAVCQSVDILYE